MPIAEKDLTGLLVVHDDQGREFAPIACGVHRSVEVGQPGGAEGFQDDCEDCATQLDHTTEAIRRESMTETGVPQPVAAPPRRRSRSSRSARTSRPAAAAPAEEAGKGG